jgi:tetratricopeptide (TPR) repeat protein
VRWAVSFCLGAGLILSPVVLRNRLVAGEWTLTASSFGLNFFFGNNKDATGLYAPLRRGRGSAEFEQIDSTRLAEQATGRKLTMEEVSHYWTTRTVAEIREDPGRWLRLMGRKWLLVWNVSEVGDAEDQYTYSDWSSLLRVLNGGLHFGILCPLAALGVCLTWRQRERLWLLYVMGLAYAASVAMFLVSSRYRFPLVPLLALFAAAGVLCLRAAVREKRWKAIGAGVVGAVVVAAVCGRAMVPESLMRATTHYNLAVQLAEQPATTPLAIVHYAEAARLRPDFSAAHAALGDLLARTGRTEEGIGEMAQALQIRPDYAEAHNNLGNALAQSGRIPEAIWHYEQALRIEPDFVEAHNGLGNALAQSGRIPEAVRHYEQALRITPDRADLHYNLGIALADLGKLGEAAGQFEQALRLKPDQAETHNSLAVVLLETGKIQEGIAQCEQALRIKPDYANAHYNLAVLLAKAGKVDEAIAQLQTALRLEPGRKEFRRKFDELQQARTRTEAR